ncbi:MAG TPA: reverse transcriptase domain-containing protein [Acidimicrobiales bacterium]|nr:reverse transcriptase domain-containing protein [Acidimicrobiales bacterium]
MRTSECGDAASKRPPSRSPLVAQASRSLDSLATDEPWLAALDAFRTRCPRRLERIADYERIIAGGDHLRMGAAVLAGLHRPAPPVEGWLNKADGRKKRVFSYPAPDELLFRTVNRLLQPAAAEAASPWCRSFLPGGGARTSFRSLLGDVDLATKAAVRLDVRDYFNSIDVDDLLARLPPALAAEPVGQLLEAALCDPRVVSAGAVVDGGRKGVMAGTPLAPLLATLYLRELDEEVAGAGATYARYSDDIIALGPPAQVAELDRLIRSRLEERGLEVNERKSSVTSPGQPWDFLGFRYGAGTVALAPLTERKLRGRSTRLARRLLRWRERSGASPERAASAFLRRINRRLYGVPGERSDFSWATWFLPMLDGPQGLVALDAHIQREARYAATGRRNPRTRRQVPYDALVAAGHVPLVSAFWAARESHAAYEDLVSRRAGLGQPAVNWRATAWARSERVESSIPSVSSTTSAPGPDRNTSARPSVRLACEAPSIPSTAARPPGGSQPW